MDPASVVIREWAVLLGFERRQLVRMVEEIGGEIRAATQSSQSQLIVVRCKIVEPDAPLDGVGNDASVAAEQGSKLHFEDTLRLPVPMLDTRVFLKLLQLELRAHPPQAPVVSICCNAATPLEVGMRSAAANAPAFARKRLHCGVAKKNNLFFLIGPPSENPKVLVICTGCRVVPKNARLASMAASFEG